MVRVASDSFPERSGHFFHRGGRRGSRTRNRAGIYIGLVHYPVVNRNKEIVASAVTNVDLHDFSRLAETYSVARFYVITPLADQRCLVEKIIRHWTHGIGGTTNPDRRTALQKAGVVDSIEAASKEIEIVEGTAPTLVVTSASAEGPVVSYREMRNMLQKPAPFLILFGTAWGLALTELSCSHVTLPPIRGTNTYNHLSVRSAAAIVLDRLLCEER